MDINWWGTGGTCPPRKSRVWDTIGNVPLWFELLAGTFGLSPVYAKRHIILEKSMHRIVWIEFQKLPFFRFWGGHILFRHPLSAPFTFLSSTISMANLTKIIMACFQQYQCLFLSFMVYGNIKRENRFEALPGLNEATDLWFMLIVFTCWQDFKDILTVDKFSPTLHIHYISKYFLSMLLWPKM